MKTIAKNCMNFINDNDELNTYRNMYYKSMDPTKKVDLLFSKPI